MKLNQILPVLFFLTIICGTDLRVSADDQIAPAFQKDVPQSIQELKEMQEQIIKVAKKVMPCVVSVQVGFAQGSGVIVSEDGYVLTAAHVSAGTGKPVVFILPGGRRVTGTSLGVIKEVDAGLLKINTKGKWPAAEMGDSKSIKVGDWCLSMGHPNGYIYSREPVARIGRVITSQKNVIQTDCTLVGGDSGGPLFDMQGRVIGINSRIGLANKWNFHAPVALFQENWDQMKAGKAWDQVVRLPRAFLGVSGVDNPQGCLITLVSEGYPAEKAGIQVGDIIQKVDLKSVKTFIDLKKIISGYEPGQKISISILRDNKTIKVETVLHR